MFISNVVIFSQWVSDDAGYKEAPLLMLIKTLRKRKVIHSYKDSLGAKICQYDEQFPVLHVAFIVLPGSQLNLTLGPLNGVGVVQPHHAG